MIVVVSAMAEELAPLAGRLDGRRRGRGPRTVEGRLGGEPVLLTWTGPGHALARAGLRRLRQELAEEVRWTLLVGVAGGLDPALRRGDVVRVERALRLEAEASVATPPERRLGGAGGGVAVTVDGIVASAGEKSALWARLGRPASAVVDMETFHWLAELSEAGARAAEVEPPVVLRAVSDPAGLSLPAFLPGCVGAGGGISRARVAARTLLQPWSAVSLLRLRRDVRHAAVRLAEAVETAVLERGAA
jgi:adenosylhomocysteine nucleosidase